MPPIGYTHTLRNNPFSRLSLLPLRETVQFSLASVASS